MSSSSDEFVFPRSGWVGRAAGLAVFIAAMFTWTAEARRRDEAARPGAEVPQARRSSEAGRAVDGDQFGGAADGIEIISGVVDFGDLTLSSERRLDRAVVVRVSSGTDWVLRVVPHSLRADRTPNLFWRSQSLRKFQPMTARAEVARGRATGPGGTFVMLDLKFAVGESDQTGQFQMAFGFELEPR